MNKTITVKIFTISKGLEVKDDIKIIRIKSKDYNLLIMEDYLPIVGKIEGNIDFESENDSLKLENVKGYYMHSNNVFNFILKED
ncbi:MAG: hypothetical protein E7169_03890 [Firmicutes bacterium]|nr:hypothetical protein [Bacillota bacterium]